MKILLPMGPSKTQYFVNQAYVTYLLEAGFEPVLVCPGMAIEPLVKEVGGLLLPGGIDLDPIYYGEDNNSSMTVSPEKDAFERKIFHTIREAGKPIFGICRGFQLIVREFQLQQGLLDGSAYFSQHIEFHNQRDQDLDRSTCVHYVSAKIPFLYGKPNGLENIPVNSMHHQCYILDLRSDTAVLRAHGLEVVAWTARGLKATKGKHYVVCEAISISSWNSPILAVQWHPEELKDSALIQNFFGLAGKEGSKHASGKHKDKQNGLAAGA